MQIQINQEFKKLIPPLSPDEFAQLEANILAEGVRETIVVARYPNKDGEECQYIADGHNRHEIATKHGLPFRHEVRDFDSEADVIIWMINNQFGRRNLTDFVKLELAQVKRGILKKQGEDKKREIASLYGRGNTKEKVLSIMDKTFIEDTPHNTQKEIAADLGWSVGKVARGEVVLKKAPEEIKQQVRAGEISINQAYQEVRKVEQAEAQRAKIVQVQTIDIPQGTESIILGDSREEIKKIGSISFVLTDPPYGMGYISNRRIASPKDLGIKNDSDLGEALDLCFDVFSSIYKQMVDGGAIFCFTRWKEERHFMEMLEEVGFEIKNSIVWVENNHGSGDVTGAFAPKHERILYATKGRRLLNKRYPDVLYGSDKRTQHPTSKPVDLLKQLIEAVAIPGEVIVDPFAGHGSTGIAAKEKGFAYRLIEDDKYNFSQIVKNLG